MASDRGAQGPGEAERWVMGREETTHPFLVLHLCPLSTSRTSEVTETGAGRTKKKKKDQTSSSWPQRSSQQSSQRSSQRSSQCTRAPLYSLHGAAQGTLSPQGPGLRSGTAIGTNCRRQPSRPGAKGRYEKERKELRQAGGGGVTRARTRTSPGYSSSPGM